MTIPIFASMGTVVTAAIADNDLVALGPAGSDRLNAEFYDPHGHLLALVGPFGDAQIARYKLADYALVPRDPLTSTEASWLLGVDPSRVRQLCLAGTLAGVRRGRDWTISADSVLAYRRTRRPVGRPRIQNEAEHGS